MSTRHLTSGTTVQDFGAIREMTVRRIVFDSWGLVQALLGESAVPAAKLQPTSTATATGSLQNSFEISPQSEQQQEAVSRSIGEGSLETPLPLNQYQAV